MTDSNRTRILTRADITHDFTGVDVLPITYHMDDGTDDYYGLSLLHENDLFLVIRKEMLAVALVPAPGGPGGHRVVGMYEVTAGMLKSGEPGHYKERLDGLPSREENYSSTDGLLAYLDITKDEQDRLLLAMSEDLQGQVRSFYELAVRSLNGAAAAIFGEQPAQPVQFSGPAQRLPIPGPAQSHQD